MKYFILVPDGCGDWPIPALGGKTPLEAADIRHINELAKISTVGTVQTIPDGMEPGSDVANLSLLGFDPVRYLTGRASLEAVGVGVKMSENETAFRTNLITLDGDGAYDDLIIKDHSSGDITSEEAEELIGYIHQKLGGGGIMFYPGVSYRCLLISSVLPEGCRLTPPHDVLDQKAGGNLPKGEGAERLIDLLRRSHELLKNHPVNVRRIKNGLNPANSIWLWGPGKKPALPSFKEKYGVRGSVISAVALVKGIGLCAGLTSINVPGATGTLHTNYAGKAAYAIDEFKKGQDFVFIHVEAPDECSHSGDLKGKVESLKRIDERIFKPVLDYLTETGGPFRVLVLPDHMTPVTVRTHNSEPVPFVWYDSEKRLPMDGKKAFSETSGVLGKHFKSGCELTDYFFNRT
jgi:2,3-bisphosphoglycerate-independent phosphoglycerate mutase